MVANQSASGLSSNFWKRFANHVKFTEKMYVSGNILMQKNIYKWDKYGLATKTRVKKIVHGGKTHWLSGKEKVPGTAVSKDYADSFLEHSFPFRHLLLFFFNFPPHFLSFSIWYYHHFQYLFKGPLFKLLFCFSFYSKWKINAKL